MIGRLVVLYESKRSKFSVLILALIKSSAGVALISSLFGKRVGLI